MIELDYEGAVARITLDRAGSRNALGLADWTALAEVVAGIATSAARVLLIRSAVPGTFCAGSDLKQLATLHDDEAARAPFRRAMRAALDGIADLPMPTIALVEGGAFGAGVALAMACDMRIATPVARFAIPPARFGILYPATDVSRLAELVGRGQAMLLLTSGTAIDAGEATRIGLVERVEADAAAAADQLAQAIAANAPTSVKLLKHMVTDFYPFIEMDGDLSLGDRLFDDAFGSAECGAGMAALAEKRAPVFGG